jgi:hypothetical protein
LQIDDVQPEHVLVNHAINAAVARAPEVLARSSRAISHPEHEIDDQFLEGGRVHRLNAIQQLCPQCHVQIVERGLDAFVRRADGKFAVGSAEGSPSISSDAFVRTWSNPSNCERKLMSIRAGDLARTSLPLSVIAKTPRRGRLRSPALTR